jgi:ParB family chromosome partitioning protein
MPQLCSKPLSWFKTNSQVRKTFDEDDLRRLGESLKVKQLQPVLCQPDGTIIAGERRLRAAKLAGLATLEVKIADEPLSDSQNRIWQLTENMQRADLSGHEKWLGCTELMCMNQTWQMKDLAEHLHLDPSMVTRLLSPSRCIPAAQEALATQAITIRDCYAISQVADAADQQRLLNLRLAPGGKLADLELKSKRARKPANGTSLKVTRIRCEVPGREATVVVSGEALSLEDMIETITDLVKEAKKAADSGIDARVFEKMCRAKAKHA